MSTDYLARILDRKRAEIAALRPWAGALKAQAAAAPEPRPWHESLRLGDRVALIAEFKRKAPSAGELGPGMDPAGLARVYEGAGAAAMSVLTDADFDGELEDLRRAREAASIPVLRKDFILDRAQLLEARAAGADAVLLIVRAFAEDDDGFRAILAATGELGMGALVEVHDESELERALEAGADVVGINNRDLSTFDVDLDVTRRLAPAVPADVSLVSESGIESAEQVEELGELGVDAVLVGTALLTHADPMQLAESLVGCHRRERG